MASAVTSDVNLRPGTTPALLPGVTTTVARLGGDLDFAAAPALRESLRRLLLPGTRLLIIDLSDVPSCDLAGLAVLIGTQRSAAARGIAVQLTTPGDQVAELLRSTGLDRSFTIGATWPGSASASTSAEPLGPATSTLSMTA